MKIKSILTKRLFYFILIIDMVFITALFAQSNSREEAIKAAVKLELQLHPKSTMADLYKNFFQGRFGPGHMISNIEDASNYLKEELRDTTESDSVLWQPVGYEQRYYRVNLSLVCNCKISFEQLLAAFTAKQDTAAHISITEWKNEWHSILEIIEKMNLNLPGFEKNKLLIEGNLDKGIIAGHHSDIFTKTYNPHYRIVPEEKFKELYEKMNTQKHKNQ
jgi:hypothetical protein